MPVTEEEFNLAAAHTQLHARAREAAYRVLVVGESAREAGEALDFSRQAAGRAANRVRRELCPPGWERVTLCMPAHQIQDLVAEADRLRSQEAELEP